MRRARTRGCSPAPRPRPAPRRAPRRAERALHVAGDECRSRTTPGRPGSIRRRHSRAVASPRRCHSSYQARVPLATFARRGGPSPRPSRPSAPRIDPQHPHPPTTRPQSGVTPTAAQLLRRDVLFDDTAALRRVLDRSAAHMCSRVAGESSRLRNHVTRRSHRDLRLSSAASRPRTVGRGEDLDRSPARDVVGAASSATSITLSSSMARALDCESPRFLTAMDEVRLAEVAAVQEVLRTSATVRLLLRERGKACHPPATDVALWSSPR